MQEQDLVCVVLARGPLWDYLAPRMNNQFDFFIEAVHEQVKSNIL